MAGTTNLAARGEQQDQIARIAQAISTQLSLSLSDQIAGALSEALAPTSMGLNDVRNDLHDFKQSTETRFGDIENNYSLSPDQISTLDMEIKARASNLLGIVWVNGRCAEECISDKKRYFGRLTATMIREMKTAVKMAQSTKWTYMPRRSFQLARDFVRTYDPVGGVGEFKRYVDLCNGK